MMYCRTALACCVVLLGCTDDGEATSEVTENGDASAVAGRAGTAGEGGTGGTPTPSGSAGAQAGESSGGAPPSASSSGGTGGVSEPGPGGAGTGGAMARSNAGGGGVPPPEPVLCSETPENYQACSQEGEACAVAGGCCICEVGPCGDVSWTCGYLPEEQDALCPDEPPEQTGDCRVPELRCQYCAEDVPSRWLCFERPADGALFWLEDGFRVCQ